MQLTIPVPTPPRAKVGVKLMAWVLLCVARVQPASAATLPQFVGVGIFTSWEGQVGTETQTTRGLTLVKWLPDRELTLCLIELPGNHRLLLDRTREIRKGVSVLRITDGRTGWRVKLTERSTLRYDSIDDLGNVAVWVQKFLASEHRVTLELEASGVTQHFRWASLLSDASRYPELFEQLDAEGTAVEIVAAIPGETRQGLRELASLLASNPGDVSLSAFQRLSEILIAALDRHGDPATRSPWRDVEWQHTHMVGMRLKEPLPEQVKAFAGTFPGVPADDPLAVLEPDQAPEPEKPNAGAGSGGS